MPMIITAAICFYNAAYELERCLESLELGKKGTVDYAICIDGKFPNFNPEGKSKLSTDGSRQVVHGFPNTILANKADYEIHKRNYYLQLATRVNTDYLLIIDSDEYVEKETVDWKLFRKQLHGKHAANPGRDVWSIDVENDSKDYVNTVNEILGRPSEAEKYDPNISPDWQRKFSPKPRIWYNPNQFEYFLNHYTWRHKDPTHPEYSRESVFSVAAWDTIPGLRLLHDHKLRNKDYLQKRLEYHRWLIQFEQQKVKHYFKHHGYKPLPHNLAKVEEWVDKDVLKRAREAS